MKRPRRKVTKEEFEKFLAEYPRKLDRDVLRICEPERIQFNDLTLGVWPATVIADYSAWGCDPNDIYAQVPGDYTIYETELA